MNKHFYILTLTLSVIVISVVSLTIYQLYTTAFNEHKEQLTVIAQSQAKLIQSMAYTDTLGIKDKSEVEKIALNKIASAYTKFKGFGKTGEINIGKLKNNNVIFLLQSRLLNENSDSIKTINRPTPIGSSYAIPMQRALLGESGTLVGSDYDNIQVLSAHEPIAGLNYGVVVKIDLSEVREPYIRAIIISIFVAIILVILGSYIFNIINNRSIRTLKNSEEKHRALIENLNDVILILDKDGVNVWNSPTVKDQFGMNPEDAVGISAIDYAHPDDVERLREKVNYAVKHPGELVFIESLKTVTPDGELHYLNDTLKYLPDTPGINGIVVVVHNNTEQVNAQKKIKEKERQYRILVETMQEGIGVQDENGIVTYVNPRFCQMLGLSIEEAVGRHVNTFFDDNNKQIVQYQMSKRKEDKNIPYEIDWLHKNGENIPTIMSPRAIIDENGNFKGSFGVLTEITELKKYQKALVESKLWMDSIYHALTESVIVLNMERELMDVNSATLSMFGYSMKELRGVSVEIFHIDHDHHLECGLLIKEYLSNSEKAKFEYKVKRKSGEIFTVEYSISKLKNAKGEQIGVVESIRDITKRKIVEEKVVKSVNDFKEAQKIAQVGSWELNLTDNSLKWSDQIYRIFNLKPQVFEATYEAFLNNIHPDDRDTVNKAYSNSLVTKKPYEITHRLKLKNGNIKYVREMCKTDFDDNGKPLRSIGTVQDITAIKLAEIELEKYKDNLEKIVYEATEELEIKNNKLRDSYLIEKANKNKLEETYSKLKKAQYQMVESEKMASLGQFTAGIAHEINNPINFIGVGIASLDENIIEVINVLEKYNQVNTENVSKKLTEINNYKKEIQFDSLLKFIQKNTINVKNGVRRTSEIIDGLRIFSRTDQDKTSIIDVHKSLDATLVILHNQYTSKNIDIVTDYGKIPKIECFQGKLNQVFTNLIMNSIHAIEDQNNPKKGVITIATKPLNNNEIAISFKDNGKGIPSDIKGKIFDPFFTSKEIGKGTGLGLSISYGIIKMHNGKIKVSSKEGKGTEFEIILPKKYSNPEG